MTSYLEILKNLQYQETQQNSISHNQQNIQASVQPDLNLYKDENNKSQYSHSFIEYVPFKRKVIQMQERLVKQKILKTKIVTYEEQQVFIQKVPKQKIITDYFAVEHLRYYRKQVIPERSIDYVPVVRTIKRKQFIPVERQFFCYGRKIVHYPKDIGPKKVKDENNDSISKSIERGYQNSKVKSSFSPIKQFHHQNDYSETEQNDFCEQSLFDSLSKAYTPEPSTQYGERTKNSYRRYLQPVSSFQQQ